MTTTTLNLSVQDHPRGKWICDAGKPIAFFYRAMNMFDIIRFSPQVEPIVEPGEIPRIYDMTSYFNMHAWLRWNNDAETGEKPPQDIKRHWKPQPDGGLTFEMLGHYDNGDHTRHTFEIGWDAELGEYSFIFSADFRYAAHCAIEFLNFYPRGACHSQAEGQRYTHTVWKGRGDKWHSFPHNGIYTSQVVGPYRVKYFDPEDGQIGFGVDDKFNPLFTVLEATPELETHTCSMWRDEHFIIRPGGLENREDGFFHTSARVRLQNLEPVAMRQLLDKSEPVSISPADATRCQYPAFTIGQLCDFETAAPVDVPGYQSFWSFAPEHPCLSWLGSGGRRKGRCLAIDLIPGRNIEERVFPTAAHPQPGPGKRCRLTAWVNTKDISGEAWIGLARHEYTPANVTDRATSRLLEGGQDWTELTVEFDTGDQELLLPELWARGDGRAKFDDVLMEILR